MKKISLQWRLTCIITLYIALVCGCLTLLVYKNGIYYIDSLQETVDARGDDVGERVGDGDTDDSDQIYISIPEDKWDEFAKDFSVQVYNNKADYKKNSLIPVSYTHLDVYKRQTQEFDLSLSKVYLGMNCTEENRNKIIETIKTINDNRVRKAVGHSRKDKTKMYKVLENMGMIATVWQIYSDEKLRLRCKQIY